MRRTSDQRVLVVGAGAVGQVFARHLQLAGAEVSFLVGERHEGACRNGFSLYPLNRSARKRSPVLLDRVGVYTRPEQVANQSWKQVYLCVSSTGLRRPGLDKLSASIGDATLIALQPGLEDREYLLRFFPDERLVSGMISFISYPAPLPGESVAVPGMAYWFPPLGPSPFSGPRGRLREVVRTLRRGGLPAKRHRDVPGMAGFPTAVLMPHLVVLELEGWSFAKASRGRRLALAAEASQEAMSVVARHHGKKFVPPISLVGPPLMRAMMALSPRVIPLDVETYLRYHFTKVGDQTRMYMRSYVERGKEWGLKVVSLERLSEDHSTGTR